VAIQKSAFLVPAGFRALEVRIVFAVRIWNQRHEIGNEQHFQTLSDLS